MTTTNDYLSKLKDLLAIPVEDNSKDGRLIFTIETVIQAICTWCNIPIVPEELDNVVLQIAEDQYRTKYASEFPETQQAIQSVKRGDVTTTFGSSKSTVKAGPGASFLQKYESHLIAYRKLRW